MSETRREKVNRVWKDFEELEPDISTERLIEQVVDETGYSHEEVTDLLDTEPEREKEGKG
jgi:hypothetical protein